MAQLPDPYSADQAALPSGVAVVQSVVQSCEKLPDEADANGLAVEGSSDKLAHQNFHSFIAQQLIAQLATCQNSVAQLSAAQINTIAPVSLAYIGDAVFELYVRSRLLIPAKKIRDYHDQVVSRVKAEQQAQYVDMLMPHFTEAEKDILRRGRNATSGRHRRAAAQSYQKATGFEALIGFLYLSDQARLLNLLGCLNLQL